MVVTTATPCFAVNLIYGCVKSGGNLEIVSGPDQCKSNQTPISWPAQGLTSIYGWIRGDGVATLGDGFTSNYDGGVYYITFNEEFAGNPGCVISLLTSPDAFCAIIGVGPSILDVTCSRPTVVNGVLSYISPSEVPFAFLCVGNVD
jgi:hypothetical protein